MHAFRNMRDDFSGLADAKCNGQCSTLCRREPEIEPVRREREFLFYLLPQLFVPSHFINLISVINGNKHTPTLKANGLRTTP